MKWAIDPVARASVGSLRWALPLETRKWLAIRVDRRSWPGRRLICTELLRDFAADDVTGYHRFVWSNHIMAEPYGVGRAFGYENFTPLRKLFFDDLIRHLEAVGVDPRRDVESVLEIGCSSGYQLRYLETDVFPSARRLDGIDIDGEAIREGGEALAAAGSEVRLIEGDMERLNALVGEARYDVVVCSGVLMYADQATAAATVREALARARRMLAVTDPPNPDVDNAELAQSIPSPVSPEGWLNHNVDAMVESAGGRVLARRYKGGWRAEDGTPRAYFVFAAGTA